MISPCYSSISISSGSLAIRPLCIRTTVAGRAGRHQTATMPKGRPGNLNPNWHGGPQSLNCLVCKKEFSVPPARANKARFCSMKCANEWQSLHPYPVTRSVNYNPITRSSKVEVNCAGCSNTFFIYKCLVGRKKFCSHECQFKWRSNLMSGKNNPNYRTGGIKECPVCFKTFATRSLHTRHCSLKCARSVRKGEKAPCWKGGKTSESMMVRNSKEYEQWRISVFERDGFVCQQCGIKGGKLAAHHIKPFSKNKELRMLISNGITLCWPCHFKIRGKEDAHAKTFQAKITTLF